MTIRRRPHRGEVTAKVVLEARRGERTIHARAADDGVPPRQISQGKQGAGAGLPTRLSSRRRTKATEAEALQAALYQQMGQVKVALEWLKKHVDPAHGAKAGGAGAGPSAAEPASAGYVAEVSPIGPV